MNNLFEGQGHYLGTEMDGKWWKRYKDNGFFARGNGTYRLGDSAFIFQKYPNANPILIPYEKITNLQIGTWHAGRWGAGRPILKILWQKDGQTLSSGFLLAKDRSDVENLIEVLAERLSLFQR